MRNAKTSVASPAGAATLENCVSDDTSSLSFLKISSMQWLPKVHFPTPLRPVLERAWLHYAIRKEQASPVAFLEWITLMRGKLVRSGSTTYTFTTDHFDLLNRLLVNYLTSTKSDGTVATKVPKSKRVEVSDPIPVEMDVDAQKGSKSSRKIKEVKKTSVIKTTPKEVADSSSVKGQKRPNHEPAVNKVKKTKAQRTPKPKVLRAVEQRGSDAEHHVEPPSPESHGSNVNEPVVDSNYVEYIAPLQNEKADDEVSVATLETLRDAPISERKRLKRAFYRFLLCNRKCTCRFYMSAVEDMDSISASVEKYLDSLPPDDYVLSIGSVDLAKTSYEELLPIARCQACAITVGQGFGLFYWSITHRVYS